MEADFSGYATKAGLRCTDGRTIMPEAFKHMDGQIVPLVWQHGHSSTDNVLGHARLEARSDGVYAYGFFNDTPAGKKAKLLVAHEDIKSLSIYANQLVERAKSVFHGVIREVSLVLSGANPGALIDFVRIAHSDGLEDEILADEAIIYTGLELEHAATTTSAVDDETIQDIIDSFNEKQKTAVAYLLEQALQSGGSLEQSDKDNSVEEPEDDKPDNDTPDSPDDKPDDESDNEQDNEGDLTHQEGQDMGRNVFDQNDNKAKGADQHVLSHGAVQGIVQDAIRLGSLRDAVEMYAVKHGIEDIDLLFPDARTLESSPQFNQRRVEWVAGVLSGTQHSPFSRVKTIVADITQEEARAKGYIKGELKKEEWFGLTKRTTSPTTIYKKQKLDRDDILDITDFDVVAWLKMEMRMMLEEELARAILIGDGRDVSHEDKIKDPIGAADGVGIRSILNDHELFVTIVNVNVDDASSSYEEVVDAVMDGMEYYKGTGTPTFYTTIRELNKFLKAKDGMGRRLYRNKSEVAEALGVRDIVTVEVMNDEDDLVGVIVNLLDYNIGADKGGQTSFFDDFDIDYNQYKYLIETRLSGALTKIKSAIVIKKTDAANVLVAPTTPTFVAATGVVTIPTKTGVVYKNKDTDATLTAGAQTALAPGATLNVLAVPASGYYFSDNASDEWSFTRPSA